MSAVFVKSCPLCGHENLAIASFCEKCDADLMNAPVAMRREESPAAPPIPLAEAAPTSALAASAPEVAPQAPDQDALVTKRADAARGDVLELEVVANPTLRFAVRAGQSVGRASKADVVLSGVPDLEYISRAHARFLQRRAQWYVQYLAEGNSITVDGMESRDDAEIAIYDGSIVVLSFTAFAVRLAS